MILNIEVPKSFICKIKSIVFNPLISNALDANLWIAGGFARKIAHEYFKLNNENSEEKINLRLRSYLKNGDIDFFSNNSIDMKKVIDNFYSRCFIEFIHDGTKVNDYEETKYSKSFYLSSNKDIDNVKIQFVDKIIHSSIEKCFEEFDIKNCKFAFYKNKDKYFIKYDINALKADRLGLLEIDHSNSPFLGRRIFKYLNKDTVIKGLSTSETTQKNLNNFLYKCASFDWDQKKYNLLPTTEKFIEYSLYLLNKKHKLNNFQLSMFIGMFNCEVGVEEDSYGIYLMSNIDWASNQIKESNKNENV